MDEPVTVDFDRVAEESGFERRQVANVVRLLDEGNTVPFITRYRKEWTGGLDEEQIRRIQQRVNGLRQVAERAHTILRLIDDQGKLTPELRQAILQADSLKRLEDLYLPYRPKRRSRAEKARERGLEPLAERIWNADESLGALESAATACVDPDNDLPEPADVLQGASDILAERIGEDAAIRDLARRTAWQTGRLKVTAKESQGSENEETNTSREDRSQAYRDYFDYTEAVTRIPPHRVLAVNRGEKEGALRVRFEWDQPRAQGLVAYRLGLSRHVFGEFLQKCVDDAIARLIHPSLEREIRRELTETAEDHAVGVFAKNLRNLLLQPPLKGRRVLAVDPGLRTGCKLAVLDESGRCLATDVCYVTGSDERKATARGKLAELLKTHECTLLAIGNGTACREAEELVAQTIAEHVPEAQYVIVNEAGASVYSTSTVARAEFPEMDATVRGTISIGRRLQDPLSELVKIDPQHLGVGMYQHDVTPKKLKTSLDDVIESCVNFVGVDLNTASASLLKYVSGLNQLVARRIVARRDENGPFRSRQQLFDVPGLGEATFTQAAGFLKIRSGDEPLDGTWIHPESYEATRRLLDRFAVSAEDLVGGKSQASFFDEGRSPSTESLAAEIGVGEPTLKDILDALARPDRDPRTDLPGPVFKRDILKLDDLQEGMELTGTVLNVVDFGAFVDVGLKDSALVHVSKMSEKFLRSPHEAVAVGDVVTVWVLGVDRERRRVSLTMIDPSRPTEKKQGRSRKKKATGRSDGKAGKPGQRRSRKRRPRGKQQSSGETTTQVTDEIERGGEPLRGFDELKQIWDKTKD